MCLLRRETAMRDVVDAFASRVGVGSRGVARRHETADIGGSASLVPHDGDEDWTPMPGSYV
jgi:hypothetical protein